MTADLPLRPSTTTGFVLTTRSAIRPFPTRRMQRQRRHQPQHHPRHRYGLTVAVPPIPTVLGRIGWLISISWGARKRLTPLQFPAPPTRSYINRNVTERR